MAFTIDVPFIRQSSDYTCWWASLRMVLDVRRFGRDVHGHRAALRKGWRRERKYTAELKRLQARRVRWPEHRARTLFPKVGLNDRQFIGLAQSNGLRPVPPRLGVGWTARELEGMLRHYGPLWCAINTGHVVVVHGIDQAGDVEVMDPERGPVTWPIVQFNGLLSQDSHALLYAPGPGEVGRHREW